MTILDQLVEYARKRTEQEKKKIPLEDKLCTYLKAALHLKMH